MTTPGITTMYYRHFGLDGAPYQFTPSPQILFLSQAHREARAALEWGFLHEPSGFTLLVGDTGTGKTTLHLSVLSQEYTRIRVDYVGCPNIDFDGMRSHIIRNLIITTRHDSSLAYLYT